MLVFFFFFNLHRRFKTTLKWSASPETHFLLTDLSGHRKKNVFRVGISGKKMTLRQSPDPGPGYAYTFYCCCLVGTKTSNKILRTRETRLNTTWKSIENFAETIFTANRELRPSPIRWGLQKKKKTKKCNYTRIRRRCRYNNVIATMTRPRRWLIVTGRA